MSVFEEGLKTLKNGRETFAKSRSCDVHTSNKKSLYFLREFKLVMKFNKILVENSIGLLLEEFK